MNDAFAAKNLRGLEIIATDEAIFVIASRQAFQ